MDIITASRRFHRHIQTRLDAALNRTGVSYAQYELLEMLHRHPRVHGAQLARQLRVTRQTVAGLLRQLSRDGLVEMTPREYWTRGANLTDLGIARLERCREAIGEVRDRIERVGSETLGRLLDLLEEIDWAMRRAEWWPVVDDAWRDAVSRR
jgi:DNA-binding MarR family transcriptional regulator